MTRLLVSLDKVSLVALARNKNTLNMTTINSEGERENSIRFLTVDRLIAEIFSELGYEEKSTTNSFMRSQYSLEHGFSGISRKGFCQFEWTGKAFLYPDVTESISKVISLCTEKTGMEPYATQAHLAFTGQITQDFSGWAKRLMHDWNPKKLLVKTYARNGEIETLAASSGVFVTCIYDKSKELKKVVRKQKQTAIHRQNYVELFRKKYGELESQSRIEFRFRSKEVLMAFSKLIREGKWTEAQEELLEQSFKRIELPLALQKKLRKSIQEET